MSEEYSNLPVGTLPLHPPEKQTIPTSVIHHMPEMKKMKKGTSRKLLKLMENLVDDLIDICQKFKGKYATPITQNTAWDTHSLPSIFGQQIR